MIQTYTDNTQTYTNYVYLDSNNIVVAYDPEVKVGQIITIEQVSTEKQATLAARSPSELLEYNETKSSEAGLNVNILYYFEESDGNFYKKTTTTFDQMLNEYSGFEYSGSQEIRCGYLYDSDGNRFIPPCPVDGYIYDNATEEWKPDPSATYDLHGDGKLYRYNEEDSSWIPTW